MSPPPPDVACSARLAGCDSRSIGQKKVGLDNGTHILWQDFEGGGGEWNRVSGGIQVEGEGGSRVRRQVRHLSEGRPYGGSKGGGG